MKNHLKKLIEAEDKKNPYTDEQLAKMLNLRRDTVTVLRSELNIPDSRERRKPYLLKEIKEIILRNPNISTRQLTRTIKESGFDVSRYLISQMAKEISEENLEPSEGSNHETNTNIQDVPRLPAELSAFNRIIGFDGSLKPQIQQAKAAILYPPHGLHTLILGPTGVGKSNLAEAMYEFALETGTLQKDAPFIIFNCADYAENPQLLLSQLFGHVKGAFTGAVVSKEGLVEKADGGILFLDEVHRLPPEGQELLYFLMDKGKFRRMGETDTERTANVLIIAATTEDIESSLLLTFRRRIPMIIELSPLLSRPLDERYKIITNFFNKEADRIGMKVKVTQQALRALLLYDCPGNIGQLRSDIQVACARGFLTYVGGQKKYVEVDLIDLPVHVRRGLLKIQNRKPEVENLLKGDLVARPGQIELRMEPKEDLYTLPGEIYQYIEERFQELELQGLSQDVINRLIGGELEVKFQQLIKRVESSHQTLAKQDLEGIVGKNIIEMAEKVTEIAQKRLGRVDKHLFYCLAVHLSATLERIQNGKPIVNPQLEKVMREYKLEYSVAKEMVKLIELLSGYKIPQDEIGFIAMYLRTITKPSDVKKGRVGVVVLSHGKVAQGMAEVANRLLGVKHVVGIEMSLDEKPESALQRTIEVVSKIDEGKGVLLLVDMGSLITFGEIITKKTGIPTKTVGRVDTVMVLEAVRRAILPDTTLDEIVESIDKDKVGLGRFVPSKLSKDKRVILTLCITGEGTAVRIKSLIEKMLPGIQEKVQIIPLGIMDDEDVLEKIENIKEKYTVSAIVGSINPKSSSIPFISLEEIIQGTGIEKLKNITHIGKIAKTTINDNYNLLTKIICEETILVNPDCNTKNEVLDEMVTTLIDHGFVKEQFLLDVYKREAMGPAVIKQIAIPHGRPENVIKPVIGIAIFKDAISWWDQIAVDCVFMLALNEDSKDILRKLYGLIKDTEFIKKLKNCPNTTDVRNSVLEFFLINN
ncbi:MAG: sigma 54-interacting transcriptional regulator [Thermoanaerobacteraceae bacterium]|nr:sigma 54-interacting transcriptional regulator [Thermoanaerobacteraceae bacterium]